MKKLVLVLAATVALTGCDQLSNQVIPEDAADNGATAAPTAVVARGMQLYMTKAEVEAALTSRGLLIPPYAIDPILYEMSVQLPDHVSSGTAWIDTSECRDRMKVPEQMTPEAARMLLAAEMMSGCSLGVRTFYNANDQLIAFYVTADGVGLGQIALDEFAQGVVDNVVGISHLEWAGSPNDRCGIFRGAGSGGERVVVTDCTTLRIQVELPLTANAQFQ